MKARYFFVGITIILLTYISCATKNDIPDSQLINEIIIETIKQDSLDKTLPVSKKLINYYLYTTKTEKNTVTEFSPPPPPPPRNEKGEPFEFKYFKLGQEKIIGYLLNSDDSVYIERQIMNSRNIELDSIKFKDIIRIENFGSWIQSEYRRENMYKFLKPIFNQDKTIAWVEYDYHCPRCGYGRMVIFKKTNNTWLKIDSFTTWRN